VERVEQCLSLPNRLRRIEEVEGYFPEIKAFKVATQQKIPRPTKNKRTQII
jgi:hypothetical protein